MKEFALIYRNETVGEVKLTPEGKLEVSKDWENWLGSIAAQNKLVSGGVRLGNEGRQVKPGGIVTNGPYAEIKEIIGGLSILRADTIEEVTELAKDCPAFKSGWNVEIREVIPMNG